MGRWRRRFCVQLRTAVKPDGIEPFQSSGGTLYNGEDPEDG
jgi:hypothetical protein